MVLGLVSVLQVTMSKFMAGLPGLIWLDGHGWRVVLVRWARVDG